MFCRQQVAQLRGPYAKIRALGAELVAIGNGTVQEAADFQRKFEVAFPLYTDPERESFRAAGLTDKLTASLHPSLALNGVRALKEGFRQGRVQGSAFQQGGALVIDRDGRLLFSFASRTGGDHVDPRRLIEALQGQQA